MRTMPVAAITRLIRRRAFHRGRLPRALAGSDRRALAFLRRFSLVFAGGAAAISLYQAALWGAASLLGAGDPYDILFVTLHGAGAREWLVAIGLIVMWPPSSISGS